MIGSLDPLWVPMVFMLMGFAVGAILQLLESSI